MSGYWNSAEECCPSYKLTLFVSVLLCAWVRLRVYPSSCFFYMRVFLLFVVIVFLCVCFRVCSIRVVVVAHTWVGICFLMYWLSEYWNLCVGVSDVRHPSKASPHHHCTSSPIPATNHASRDDKNQFKHFVLVGKAKWKGYCLYQNYCTTCRQATWSAAMDAVFRRPPHPQLNIGKIQTRKTLEPYRNYCIT